MAQIKRFKPTTPSLRVMSKLVGHLTPKSTPLKSALAPKKSKAGRNAHGRITTRHHGGGVKQKYRVIDFKRNKLNVPARVDSIQHDPNRSCNIALLVYADGYKSYILAPVGLKAGDSVVSSSDGNLLAS